MPLLLPPQPARPVGPAPTAPARAGSGRLGVLALLAGATLLGAGCAATAPMADLKPAALEGRTIAAITGSTPSFYADTPARRTFGILGVMAMMRSGNQLVERYGLQDPSGLLSDELVAAIADGNGLQTADAQQADLLLEVKTTNWDFRPFRKDPDDLFVVYTARVTLLDRRTGARLAGGKCRTSRDPGAEPMSLDDLLADDARRLHSALRDAGLKCAQRMKQGTLSAFLRPSVQPVAQRRPLDTDPR